MIHRVDRVALGTCAVVTILMAASLDADYIWLSGSAWLAGAPLAVWGMHILFGNAPTNRILRLAAAVWVVVFSGLLVIVIVSGPAMWFTPFVVFMAARALLPLLRPAPPPGSSAPRELYGNYMV